VIPLNDFQRQWEDTREDALAAFETVGSSGWYILGREVRAFEEALASYWGVAHAVGVASGLDALEISLRAAGCGVGDRVLTTPLSAFPTTLAILKLGAIPVFVDVGETGGIDLEQCGATLAVRPDIRFFLPVHLYGHPLDMRRLRDLGKEFGCRTVEDAAQAIGACHGGLAAVSFYPTKNLGAPGDAGAILTDDVELAETARRLRDYGQSSKYQHDIVGYNSRLDELHAAYLRRVGLKRLDGWNAARRRIAAMYIAGIRNPAIRVMAPPTATESVWHLFPVLVDPDRKADFMAWLKSRGVGCGAHYPIAIPDQRAMEGLPFEVIGGIEGARRICRSEVSLPVHPYLQEEEVAQVVKACNEWEG